MKAGCLSHKQCSHPTATAAKQSPANMAHNIDLNDANANMQDYLRSIINRVADRRANQVLMNKIHNKFSNFFQELDVLKPV